MPSYLSPGIYVEEQAKGPRPIEGVGTSVAGFVGTAPNSDARRGEAVAVNNWSQFKRIFVRDKDGSTDLANAVQGFFLNGGSRCYVANIAQGSALSGKGEGLDALDAIDEIAIIAAPGRTDVASYRALLDSAESLKDRIAILDTPPTVGDVEALTRVASVGSGSDDEAKSPKGQAAAAGSPESDRGYGARYFPSLRISDAIEPDKIVTAPPSGHIAGLYARTDAERGVHKAPANLAIRGALGLTQIVTRAEQDVLNPVGVNVIRFFTREGVRVWGARTNSSDPAWKYVNVRRLFMMIEESIAIGTRWVVFEPNDRPLWKDVTRDISAFLRLLWSQGALAGSRPEDAFYVICNEETNPPEVIDAGQLIIEIGIAPVKPAEFVIIRIGQSQAGATVETV